MIFSTALEGFSSVFSLLALIYVILVCGYFYSSIESIKQFKQSSSNTSLSGREGKVKIVPVSLE